MMFGKKILVFHTLVIVGALAVFHTAYSMDHLQEAVNHQYVSAYQSFDNAQHQPQPQIDRPLHEKNSGQQQEQRALSQAIDHQAPLFNTINMQQDNTPIQQKVIDPKVAETLLSYLKKHILKAIAEDNCDVVHKQLIDSYSNFRNWIIRHGSWVIQQQKGAEALESALVNIIRETSTYFEGIRYFEQVALRSMLKWRAINYAYSYFIPLCLLVYVVLITVDAFLQKKSNIPFFASKLMIVAYATFGFQLCLYLCKYIRLRTLWGSWHCNAEIIFKRIEGERGVLEQILQKITAETFTLSMLVHVLPLPASLQQQESSNLIHFSDYIGA